MQDGDYEAHEEEDEDEDDDDSGVLHEYSTARTSHEHAQAIASHQSGRMYHGGAHRATAHLSAYHHAHQPHPASIMRQHMLRTHLAAPALYGMIRNVGRVVIPPLLARQPPPPPADPPPIPSPDLPDTEIEVQVEAETHPSPHSQHQPVTTQHHPDPTPTPDAVPASTSAPAPAPAPSTMKMKMNLSRAASTQQLLLSTAMHALPHAHSQSQSQWPVRSSERRMLHGRHWSMDGVQSHHPCMEEDGNHPRDDAGVTATSSPIPNAPRSAMSYSPQTTKVILHQPPVRARAPTRTQLSSPTALSRLLTAAWHLRTTHQHSSSSSSSSSRSLPSVSHQFLLKYRTAFVVCFICLSVLDLSFSILDSLYLLDWSLLPIVELLFAVIGLMVTVMYFVVSYRVIKRFRQDTEEKIRNATYNATQGRMTNINDGEEGQGQEMKMKGKMKMKGQANNGAGKPQTYGHAHGHEQAAKQAQMASSGGSDASPNDVPAHAIAVISPAHNNGKDIGAVEKAASNEAQQSRWSFPFALLQCSRSKPSSSSSSSPFVSSPLITSIRQVHHAKMVRMTQFIVGSGVGLLLYLAVSLASPQLWRTSMEMGLEDPLTTISRDFLIFLALFIVGACQTCAF